MAAAEQIERFRRDLFALTGGTAPDRLGLAVSGGPDSVALLLLANEALPGQVAAATVDHRLRPESADEARFVASLCGRLGVPHSVLADPETAIQGASAQARARSLRYRLLGAWTRRTGLCFLATGHHLDDQAETVLMRLARGAGLAGLAAVRARRNEGPLAIVRPLLGWRRTELAEIVASAGLEAVDDPSNRCDAYERTRFRSLLGASDLLSPPRLAAAAANLAHAEEALAWAADREWRARAEIDGDSVTLDPAGLPPELLRRLAARAVDMIRGDLDWRRDKLASAIFELAQGRGVTLGGVRIRAGTRWRFEPEPPRRAV